MDSLLEVTVLFTLVLAFSLLIERVLEILNAVYDLADSHWNWSRYWTRRAEKVRDRLVRRLRSFEYVAPGRSAVVLRRLHAVLKVTPRTEAGQIPVVCGDLMRRLAVKIASKVVGIALGIWVAVALHLDLVERWGLSGQEAEMDVFRQLTTTPQFRWILTGAIMGLGSTLVHKVIAKLEHKQKAHAQQGALS